MLFRKSFIVLCSGVEGAPVVIRDDRLAMRLSLTVREPGDTDMLPMKEGDCICEVTHERELTPRIESEVLATNTLSSRKQMVDDINSDINQFTRAVLRIIRWRLMRLDGPQEVRCLLAFEWSQDGALWLPVITDWTPCVRAVGAGSSLNSELQSEVEQMLARGAREPFAHELWREAYVGMASSPRSSLIFAVMAAEIGFKQFAARMSPDAKWILENIPSP